MSRIIGCIGCGNMGSAILGGFAKTLSGENWRLCGYNRTPARMEPLTDLGIQALPSIGDVAKTSDIIIFAVKPYQMDDVLRAAAPSLKPGAIAISIAAGYSLAQMEELLGPSCMSCRCMPTTTALVQKGVFAFCFAQSVQNNVKSQLLDLFGHLGLCMELGEAACTNFSALVGAGPAYVFAVMHALQQAGVTMGFTRAQSRQMIIELFAGSAALAQAQQKTFMELRDDVCSPGGLTIAGINVFDRAGLTGIVVDAVEAAARRGREMES